MAFTAVFLRTPQGYIGFVEELPGANTQGATLAEARRNLKEAVRLVLDASRRLSLKQLEKKRVIREKIEALSGETERSASAPQFPSLHPAQGTT
jgi:predicted RNase H-like HicB family nuclease